MAAKGKLYGTCFGLGDPEDQNEESQKRGMRIVADHFEWIRIYSPENCSAYMHELGLKIAPTAWVGKDEAENFAAVDKLIEAAKKGLVDLAIIGNEMLFRKDCSPEHLVDCIRRFKEAMPRIPVTCGEVEEFLIKYPFVMDACDVVGMHHYPFWCGIHVDKAMEDFDRRYRQVKALAAGKEVQILETGWPSSGLPPEGIPRGAAFASVKNARQYFHEFKSWAHENNVKYFWFEAFDEQWKAGPEGSVGKKWGMWNWPKVWRKYA